MELIEFLDQVEIEIIRMVEKAGYSIEENKPLCLLGRNYVGFFKKRQKTIVICTENAIKREGYTLQNKRDVNRFERTAKHIKKALRHESIHIAQECNNGNLLYMKKELSMNPAKLEALNGSIKISGEEEKEKQAYILEDSPKEVKKVLIKYCL